MKYFTSSFFHNFKSSFVGRNIFWHLLAILLTVVITASNLDWHYFLSMQNQTLNQIFSLSIPAGYVIPIFLPPILIALGWWRRDKLIEIYGLALMQAAAVGWIISAIYKALTNRVPPDIFDQLINYSQEWDFGLLKQSVYWGWPSSHTTVAFAMVATLIVLLGKNRPLTRWVALAYTFYIGIGISFSAHWLSEFVAGVIIGTVTGITVGRWWKEHLPTPPADKQPPRL